MAASYEKGKVAVMLNVNLPAPILSKTVRNLKTVILKFLAEVFCQPFAKNTVLEIWSFNIGNI